MKIIPTPMDFECQAMATARCIGPWTVLLLRSLLAASYVGAMECHQGRRYDRYDESFLGWMEMLKSYVKHIKD